jgi:hypothetical protein
MLLARRRSTLRFAATVEACQAIWYRNFYSDVVPSARSTPQFMYGGFRRDRGAIIICRLIAASGDRSSDLGSIFHRIADAVPQRIKSGVLEMRVRSLPLGVLGFVLLAIAVPNFGFSQTAERPEGAMVADVTEIRAPLRPSMPEPARCCSVGPQGAWSPSMLDPTYGTWQN